MKENVLQCGRHVPLSLCYLNDSNSHNSLNQYFDKAVASNENAIPHAKIPDRSKSMLFVDYQSPRPLHFIDHNAQEIDIKALAQSLRDWESAAPTNDERLTRTTMKSMVLSCARNKSISLNFRNCQLSELPTCLAQLTHLKRLDLSRNNFKCLPDFLGELKKIEVLDLSHNQIEDLPATFKNLQSLSICKLNDNQLVSFPAVLAEIHTFTEMYLQNNNLKTLPAWIAFLTKLHYIDISHNQFSQLPDEILDGSKKLKIEAAYNLLPPEMILALTNAARQPDYSGPVLCVAEVVDEVVYYTINSDMSLRDNLHYWLQGTSYSEVPSWAANMSRQANNFNLLLNRLRTIKDFESPIIRETISYKISLVVQQMSHNSDFCEQAFSMAAAAVSTCQDGVSVGFDDIYMAAIVDQYGATYPTPDLFRIGRDQCVLTLIRKMVHDKAQVSKKDDPLVDYLAYLIGLRSFFTIIDVSHSMVFEKIAKVTPNDLEDAKVFLTEQLNAKSIRAFFLNWPIWHKACASLDEIREANEGFFMREDQLGCEAGDLSSKQYSLRMKILQEERERILNNIYGNIYDQLLSSMDNHVCIQ